MSQLISQTYSVKGMTCGHCVAAVTDELRSIETVTEVRVDLDAASATVTSTVPLTDDAVAAAIDEAGYELAGTVDS